MTIRSPGLMPLVTSMSVAPVMPVVTGTNDRDQFAALVLLTHEDALHPGLRLREGLLVRPRPCRHMAPCRRAVGSRMVSAWMEWRRYSSLCAVVIFAVAERPGRRSSEGWSRVTTTLKSLASSAPVVDWLVATAGGAQEGLVADLGHVAFEDFAGKRIDGDVGGLADGDIDDVGLVDLDLGGDDATCRRGS